MKFLVSDMLFSLLKSEILGSSLPDGLFESITHDDLVALYKLAKSHDVVHIIAVPLLSNASFADEKLKTSYNKEQLSAVFRHVQQRHELERTCRAFEDAGIDHIPLKGAVIRRFYPRPELRTSCDIDIYVRREDFDRAERVMREKLNYTSDVKTPHDISFYSTSKVHIELHHDFFENGEKVNDMLSTVWESARADGDFKHRFLMDDDLFVAYHIAHIAKHFSSGGCGIRPLLDLCILEDKMGYNEDAVINLLSSCNLDKFAKNTILLTRVWFKGANFDEMTEIMSEYIINSALYGTLENYVAIKQSRRGGRLGYVMGRLFMPYSKMKLIYPSLRRFPPLLPFCWVRRWFSFVRRGRASRAKMELKISGNVSKEKQAALISMLDNLGLEE